MLLQGIGSCMARRLHQCEHAPTVRVPLMPQISAKKGTGVDDLLEQLLLVAEVGADACLDAHMPAAPSTH